MAAVLHTDLEHHEVQQEALRSSENMEGSWNLSKESVRKPDTSGLVSHNLLILPKMSIGADCTVQRIVQEDGALDDQGHSQCAVGVHS